MLKTYDTKEAVPAELQATAIETKDGKFVVEEADPALGDKGKKALDDERKARKDADDRAKAAEKERDDLKRENEARRSGATEEELKKIRDAEAAARKPIEDALAEETRKREAAEQENTKLKLTDRVQKLALDNGVMADRIEDAMLSLKDRTRLGDKDGIIFKDKAGTDTTDTPAQFFPKFKAEKPWLFAGSGSSGGGAGDPPTPIASAPGTSHPAVPGRF